MEVRPSHMPVTIYIHKDVYRELSEEAAPFKQSVSEIAEEILEDHVIMRQRESDEWSSQDVHRNSFPD